MDALDRSETVLGRAVTVARLSGIGIGMVDEDHRRRKKKKKDDKRTRVKKLNAKKSNNAIIYIQELKYVQAKIYPCGSTSRRVGRIRGLIYDILHV